MKKIPLRQVKASRIEARVKVGKKVTDPKSDFLLPRDSKRIQKLANEKARHLKIIQGLDRQIILVQDSTKTTIPQLVPWHNYFRMKFGWYYNWHLKPYAKITHWLILLIYLISLPLGFWSISSKSPIVQATNPTYDFPRWEWESPIPTGNALNGMEMINSSNIWVVGANGTILHYTTNWSQSYSGVDADLNDISAADEANIWAVGKSGKILKTINGGLSWTEQVSGISTQLNAVKAISTDVVWAAGASGIILKTIDGGTTWSAQTSNTPDNLKSIDAIDSNNAWSVGENNVMKKTSDGGTTWSDPTSKPFSGHTYNSIDMIDQNTIWGVTNNNKVFRTTDSGVNWISNTSISVGASATISAASSDTAFIAGTQIQKVVYANDSWGITTLKSGFTGTLVSIDNVSEDGTTKLWTIGQRDVSFGSWPIVYTSNNNGSSWDDNKVISYFGEGDSFFSISFADAETGWAVGWGPTAQYAIYKKSEAGWENQFNNIIGPAEFGLLYDVSVAPGNPEMAIAVGSYFDWSSFSWKGVVVSKGTDNGADTWHPAWGSTFGEELRAIQTFNATYENPIIAYAVGDNGRILKNLSGDWYTLTQEGGSPWTDKYLFGLSCLDNQNCWAVGEDSVILATSDGGTTWQQKHLDVGTHLYSVKAFQNGGNISVWASGSHGTILRSNDSGATWSTQTYTGATVNDEVRLTATDSNNAWGVIQSTDDLSRKVIRSTDGTTWNTPQNLLNYAPTNIYAQSASSVWVTGWSSMAHYTAPANATATKLLVKLPGQSFADGVGVYGTPNTAKAGDSVTATIYAVDNNNVLDKGNTSNVGFTTTDPNDSNPATIQLTNGGNCSQSNPVPNYPCGIGTAIFTFHTPGTWTITANDTGSVLSAGTSSSITVNPGDPRASSFTGPPSTLKAGEVSGEIKVQLKDLYSNNTTAASNTIMHLSTTSTKGRFSTSTSGPWSIGSKDITIPSGSGTASFYYLDLATGSATITASETPSAGWTDAQSTINITTGELSQSALTVDKNSVSAGETINTKVILKNNQGVILPDKKVQLFSSRSDIITPSVQTTDSEGMAIFSVRPTLAGNLILTAYDQSDNLYIPQEQNITVSPGALSKIGLTADSTTKVAGTAFHISLTLYDSYGNIITDYLDRFNFSSSDRQLEIREDQGQYKQTVVLKTAGNQSITASSKDGKVSATLYVNVVPAAVSTSVSTIFSDKTKIKPKEETATITVTIKDAFGNGIENKSVELISNRQEDTITPKIEITTKNGLATFLLSSEAEGESILSAIDLTDNLTLQVQLKIKVAFPSLLETIQQSKIVKKITKAITPIAGIMASLGFISLLIPALQSIPQIFHAVGFFSPILLTAARFRRKRKPWGVVFDALSGKPVDLAIVRLFDAETRHLIETKVTDDHGRFNFLVAKGRYYITITKTGYTFPAKVSKIKASQESTRFGPESDIYLGEIFSIKIDDTNINLNIPLDVESIGASLFGKIKIQLKEAFDWFLISISYIAFPMMIIGGFLSIIVTIISYSGLNIFLSIAYIVLLSIFLITRRIRASRVGLVFDSQTKKPIPNAVVSVFDKEYNAIRETKMTDRYGRFNILAHKGNYYLTVDAKGYKFPSTILKNKKEDEKLGRLYFGETIDNPKTSFVNFGIPLDEG